jgi:hypothetical protein
MLDQVVGDSRTRLREFEERERRSKAGELPVPYALRPSFVIHYLSDVFTLWRVSQRSKVDERQYHLVINVADELSPTRPVLRDVPLLDICALIVLSELDAFDSLLRLFPRVAVPQRTLEFISQSSNGVLVSPAAREIGNRILKSIDANLAQIDQPYSHLPRSDKAISNRDVFDDFVELARTGRWSVYTDDVISRVWVKRGKDEPHPHHLTTVDVLRLAENEGILSPLDVAVSLERLASWNVGITVQERYFLASLSGAIHSGSKLAAARRLDRFQHHHPFAPLARAVWHPGKPRQELITHMGAILVTMLQEPLTEDDSVAAVWGFWFFRVRLISSPDELEWQLLCFSLMAALRVLPDQFSRRALSTYLSVVELATGDDDKVSANQKTAIQQLADLCARIAVRHPGTGESLRKRINLGLVAGTAEGDLFASTFVRERARSERERAA